MTVAVGSVLLRRCTSTGAGTVSIQRDIIFLITNHRFAGLSAKRRIYHGNQAVP